MIPKLYTNVKLEAIPVDPDDIVNKGFVELLISGKIKTSVRAVMTEDLTGSYDATAKTLTQSTAATLTVDGVTIVAGDRILLASQSDLKQNGIYVVTTAGSSSDAAVLTRAEDFDDADDIALNVLIPVREGDEFADTSWTLINDTIPVLDTDDMLFDQASGKDGGAKSYTETFTGDGVTHDFDIVHDFNNVNVSVTVLESSTKEKCNFDIIIKDSNTVTIHSDSLLTAEDSFDVIVIG